MPITSLLEQKLLLPLTITITCNHYKCVIYCADDNIATKAAIHGITVRFIRRNVSQKPLVENSSSSRNVLCLLHVVKLVWRKIIAFQFHCCFLENHQLLKARAPPYRAEIVERVTPKNSTAKQVL